MAAARPNAIAATDAFTRNRNARDSSDKKFQVDRPEPFSLRLPVVIRGSVRTAVAIEGAEELGLLRCEAGGCTTAELSRGWLRHGASI